mgnify:FL=1
MTERDMMYGGYYQNMPGSMIQSNYGFELPPGALMQNNMMTPYNNMNNPIIELNNRLTSLENRVKLLEQNQGGNTNIYQDDNSLYII